VRAGRIFAIEPPVDDPVPGIAFGGRAHR
jgi:hypothetical protein